MLSTGGNQVACSWDAVKFCVYTSFLFLNNGIITKSLT